MSAFRDPFDRDVRMCAPHQSRMKSAIMARGLWSRTSKTTEQFLARAKARNPYDPCPLSLLNAMVMGKLRHTAAMNDVQVRAGTCPVCMFDASPWIEEAADAIAKRLVELDAEAQADRENNRRLEEDARSA